MGSNTTWHEVYTKNKDTIAHNEVDFNKEQVLDPMGLNAHSYGGPKTNSESSSSDPENAAHF